MKTKKYAIVDIETTGGMAKRDKITEVGIVLFDGKKVIDQYSTLINPGISIPPYITSITGITNEMVADAPRFYEVAKKIVEMTDEAIFVAHNVRFDYSFLKEAFKNLGYTFSRKQLCTVRLSRKVFPGLRSYSLGNLIRHFGIPVHARHRALDDALATAKLLSIIMKQDEGTSRAESIINHGIKTSKLPIGISMDTLRGLPEGPGIYYFRNTYGDIIYIGKSKHIRKRVMQHFSATGDKAEKMSRLVASIDTIETGSELIAMLLESKEIKKHQPQINKAQRTRTYPYFIHHFIDDQGFIRLEWLKSSLKTRKNKNILSYYGSKLGAISHLTKVTTQYTLCKKLCSLEKSENACFSYSTKNCYGACIAQEEPQSYNERAEMAIDAIKKIFDHNFIIITEGRSHDEAGIILVEEGNYKGYGYIQREDMIYGIEEMKEAIKYESINPEANGIIRNFLEKNPFTKTIGF